MSSLSAKKFDMSDDVADIIEELPSGTRGATTRSAAQQHVLDGLDAQKFGWPQIRVILIAGVGFFTSAYDIFAINLATTILGAVYFHGGALPKNTNTGIKVSALVGIFCGQLVFGFLSDRLGRKKMYGIELMCMIIGTLGTAIAGQAYHIDMFAVIMFWRVFGGFGMGGDYPVSAVISSEWSGKATRGQVMAAVFAFQSFGLVSCAIIAVIALAAGKNAIMYSTNNLDVTWRFVIGFGIVPGCIALYWRLNIPETPRYTIDVENSIEDAQRDWISGKPDVGDATAESVATVGQLVTVSDKGTWADFRCYFSQTVPLRMLVGTSLAWFLQDIAFYGIQLNNGVILSAIGWSQGATIWHTVFNTAVGNIIINLMGTLPGYCAAIFLIEPVGRKRLQMIGFGFCGMFLLIMGVAFNKLKENAIAAFIVLFALAQFFSGFVASTTFVIPGEAFPTRYRATAHGIAAAAGKIGAIITTVVFGYLTASIGVDHTIIFMAGINFLGAISTLLLVETRGKSLDELGFET